MKAKVKSKLKLEDRVLLQVTDDCAINCRFCFRRYMRNKITDWEAIYVYISNHLEVGEVILSGGDPLILKHEELLKIINQLAKIPHLKRLRIHTIPLPCKVRSIIKDMA